jgi:hypothetical protein
MGFKGIQKSCTFFKSECIKEVPEFFDQIECKSMLNLD